MVKGFNWAKGVNRSRDQTGRGFRLSESSIGSRAQNIEVVNFFRLCVQMVQGFKWFKGLQGSRAQYINLFKCANGPREQMVQGSFFSVETVIALLQ